MFRLASCCVLTGLLPYVDLAPICVLTGLPFLFRVASLGVLTDVVCVETDVPAQSVWCVRVMVDGIPIFTFVS